MIIPFSAKSVRVTSSYGERTFNGTEQNHSGYDLVGIGSHIVAAAVGGKVIRSRIVTDKANLTWQWGNYICIQTEENQYHYYCHLASRAVNEGQTVKAGDTLGVMGSTGYSFGAHLHFEVRDAYGKAFSPESVLGIPNAVGIYTMSTLESDINTLMKHGIISSPVYWQMNAAKMQYLPELIHNMAEALK